MCHQQLLTFAPSLLVCPPPRETNSGAVYTKEWVARFVLDLAGYSETANLLDALAIEPAATN